MLNSIDSLSAKHIEEIIVLYFFDNLKYLMFFLELTVYQITGTSIS